MQCCSQAASQGYGARTREYVLRCARYFSEKLTLAAWYDGVQMTHVEFSIKRMLDSYYAEHVLRTAIECHQIDSTRWSRRASA